MHPEDPRQCYCDVDLDGEEKTAGLEAVVGEDALVAVDAVAAAFEHGTARSLLVACCSRALRY